MNPNTKGALFMVVAGCFYPTSDMLTKVLLQDFQMSFVLLVRTAGLVVFLWLLIPNKNALWRSGSANLRTLGGRALCELGATVFFLLALQRLPLFTIGALLQLIPILIAAFSAYLYRERLSTTRLLCLVVGLFGSMLVLQLGAVAFNSGVGWLVLGIACMIGRELLTKAFSPGSCPLSISCYSALPLLCIAAGMLLFDGGVAAIPAEYSLSAILLLLGSALTMGIAFYTGVQAMRFGSAVFTAPFRYTSVIWPTLFSHIIFNERTTLLSWVGIVLITLAGLYLIWREPSHG